MGTEQWGMESGGAPWGATPHAGPSSTTESVTSSTTTRSVDTAMFGHHTSSDPWLVGTKSSVVQSNQDVNKVSDKAHLEITENEERTQ